MAKRLTMLMGGVLLSTGMALAQTAVTGKVTSSDDGSPVVGASIKVVGTNTGTVTDIDGNFVLNVPANSKVVVSYIGMLPKTLKITKNMKVILDPDNQALDDVLVIAYGKTKKSAFTGSAAEIKSDEITAHVSSTATSALVGKVAGIQATSSSGEPGSSPTIRIRGIGSVSASSEPLYIVDGAPYEAGISNINPADIESISVQKDASASAIYGARGANGVIIITTKRARDGQDARVTFDAKWGSNSRLIPQYDVISDPAQYYETHFKAMYNSQYYHGATADEAYAYACKYLYDSSNKGLGYQVYTVSSGEQLIGRDFKINPNAKLGYSDGTYYYTPDNWYDETYHNSFRQEYNANVTGSSGKMNYFASGGYLQDGGIVDNSELKRYTARASVDYQAKKWLKLSTGLSFTHTDSESPYYDASTWASSGNLFYITNMMAPIYPLYVRNADGSIKTESGRKVYDSNQTNFVRPAVVGNAVRDNEYNRSQTYNDIFQGQWDAQITPIDGLVLDANLNVFSNNNRWNGLYSQFSNQSSTDGATAVSATRTFTSNQRYTATYDKSFADVHHANILVGYEQYKYKYQYLYGYNDHLFNPYIGELDNALGTSQKSNSSFTNNYMTEGFFGRIMYDYNDKYFLNASLRHDASSAFAPGHRWGTFGSVGLAWQMNKESFLKDVKWIDLLKLKVSYGTVGNDQLGSASYSSTVGNYYYYWADRYTTSYNESTKQYSISMSQKGNDQLTWETHNDWNLGVDFALFKNRLSGTIEYYHQKTNDLLWAKTLPLSSGISVSSYYSNIGSVVNRGFEVSLEGTPVKTKDIQWDLNFNATFNHNEITALDPSIDEGGLKGSYYIQKVGGSVYEAYMTKYAGVNQETGEAQWYMDVTDDNGNVTQEVTTDITEATKYDLGTTLPTVVGGFGTSVSAYGFDLTAQFSYQLGGKIYDGMYQSLMHNGYSAGQAMHKDLLNAWSEDNKDSNIPRLSNASGDDAGFDSQTAQDRFLTSSNYLSLNNLTLGYTFPKALIRPLALTNLRIYVAGENLFVLTKRKGLDPRYNYGLGSMTSGAGLSSGSYATLRSVTAGISLTF